MKKRHGVRTYCPKIDYYGISIVRTKPVSLTLVKKRIARRGAGFGDEMDVGQVVVENSDWRDQRVIDF